MILYKRKWYVIMYKCNKINYKTNPHPAPFPLELAKRCIESVGEGPVLDPFLGSGTTAVAAQLLDIKWIGIDKSPTYCNLARQRLKQVCILP